MVSPNKNTSSNPTMNDVEESGSGKESEDEIQYDEEKSFNKAMNSQNEEKYGNKDDTIEIDGETTNTNSEENHEENKSDGQQNKDMNEINNDESYDKTINIQNNEGDDNLHEDKMNAVNNNANVEIQPLINSCVALGSSLLSQYGPSGDKRMQFHI